MTANSTSNASNFSNQVKQLASLILNHESDGRTIEIHSALDAASGFAIALATPILIVNNDRKRQKAVEWYIAHYFDEISSAGHIGCWRENEKFYILTTVVHYSPQSAIELAKRHEQRFIYCFELRRSLSVQEFEQRYCTKLHHAGLPTSPGANGQSVG